MESLESLTEWFLDNARNLLFPESWLAVDSSLSKLELLALFLVQRRGEMMMSQLAESLNIPLSTATGLSDRLVKQGYLLRERQEADRRVVSIHLSPQGQATIISIRTSLSAWMSTVSQSLEPAELGQLVRLVQKIIGILGQGAAPSSNPEAPTIQRIVIE